MEREVHWPGWEVVRLVGKGSFGSVYEIQRDVFGTVEKAALKVMSIPQDETEYEELLADGYDAASVNQRYQSYLEEIVQEYSLMAKLKGNSNIVDCDDLQCVPHKDGFGWDIYIKMELLTPLTKALGRDIEESQVVKLGIDICNALNLCKSMNIVHRDIKPQNIFVSRYGDYKLGDFGIAKIAERTASGTKTGTFKYMAPEVYNNEPYGSASDLYSLGLVLYWMLNERRTPFLPLPPQVPTAFIEEEARRRRFCGERIPEPAHGSPALKKIVCKACAFDPANRYASPAELLQALKTLGSQDSEDNRDDPTVYEPPSVTQAVPKDCPEPLVKPDRIVSQETMDPSHRKIPIEAEEPEEQAVRKTPQREQNAATVEKSGGHDKKKLIVGLSAAVLALVLLALIVHFATKAGNSNSNSDSSLPQKPYIWILERDAQSLLDAQGVGGSVTELEVIEEEQYDQYQTYKAYCVASVTNSNEKGDDVNEDIEIVLVYELENENWVVSGLSKIND